MMIIARAMIRNKPDSYCQSWDVRTHGVTAMVRDLLNLYRHYGVDDGVRASGTWVPSMLLSDGQARRASLWKRLFR